MFYSTGTPWEVNLDDTIFAFEEVGSSPHGIDRMLLHLSQAGKLKRVRGVVVGDLTDCEWSDGGGAPWPHTRRSKRHWKIASSCWVFRSSISSRLVMVLTRPHCRSACRPPSMLRPVA